MFLISSYINYHSSFIKLITIIITSMIVASVNYIDHNNKITENSIAIFGYINGFSLTNINNSTYKGEINISYKYNEKVYTYNEDVTGITNLNNVILKLKLYTIGEQLIVYTDLQGKNPNLNNVFGTTESISNAGTKKTAFIILYVFMCILSLVFLPIFVKLCNQGVNDGGSCFELINNLLFIICISWSFNVSYPSYVLLGIAIFFKVNTVFQETNGLYFGLVCILLTGMCIFLGYFQNEYSPLLVVGCYIGFHIIYMIGYIAFTYEEKWSEYTHNNEVEIFRDIPLQNIEIQVSPPSNLENPDIKKVKCVMCSKISNWNINSPPSYGVNTEDCIVCTDKKPLVYLEQCGHTVVCKECIVKMSEVS